MSEVKRALMRRLCRFGHGAGFDPNEARAILDKYLTDLNTHRIQTFS